MSVFNSNLGMNLSRPILTLLNVLILMFLISFYLYVRKTNSLDKLLRGSLLIIISANICTIIDKVFWGGSLDFIVFFGYIIDIKDILLYLGVFGGIVVYLYKYEIRKKDMDKIKDLSVKGYFSFLKSIFTK